MNVGITESLSFTRNRIVESYLCAMGVAFEPQYGNLRKVLAKVIEMILVLDDVYDIYGSFEELEQFTMAVNRLVLTKKKIITKTIIFYLF